MHRYRREVTSKGMCKMNLEKKRPQERVGRTMMSPKLLKERGISPKTMPMDVAVQLLRRMGAVGKRMKKKKKKTSDRTSWRLLELWKTTERIKNRRQAAKQVSVE